MYPLNVRIVLRVRQTFTTVAFRTTDTIPRICCSALSSSYIIIVLQRLWSCWWCVVQPRRPTNTIKHTHYIHTTRTTAVDFLMDPLVFRVIRFGLFADNAACEGGEEGCKSVLKSHCTTRCSAPNILYVYTTRGLATPKPGRRRRQ